MRSKPRITDTSLQVEQRQVEAWRRMTPAAKLSLVLQMSANVRQLAMAGVRRRHPHASPIEHRLRLAQVLLGDALARKVYPEIEGLDTR